MKLSSRRSTNMGSILLKQDSSSSDESSIGSTKRRVVRKGSGEIQKRRTIKERKLRSEKVFNGGRWTSEERLNFLRGLRKFGPGNWKKIQTILTTRSNIQIKSHGQKVQQRMQAGEDIFWELNQVEAKAKENNAPMENVQPPSQDVSFTLEADEENASIVSDVTCNETATVATGSFMKKTPFAPLVCPPQEIKKVAHQPMATITTALPMLPLVAPQLAARTPFPILAATKPVPAVGSEKPLPSLSISEATVVLALCELSAPVKSSARITATASKYATNLPFKVMI